MAACKHTLVSHEAGTSTCACVQAVSSGWAAAVVLPVLQQPQRKPHTIRRTLISAFIARISRAPAPAAPAAAAMFALLPGRELLALVVAMLDVDAEVTAQLYCRSRQDCGCEGDNLAVEAVRRCQIAMQAAHNDRSRRGRHSPARTASGFAAAAAEPPVAEARMASSLASALAMAEVSPDICAVGGAGVGALHKNGVCVCGAGALWLNNNR